MTMLVDRRKDNYDELLVLANDSRASRARVNRWTTGLVVGAMAATAAYVATMNQQVDELRETTKAAEQGRDKAELAFKRILDERDLLMVEMEALERYLELYADIVPTQALSNSIAGLAERLGSGTGPAPDTKFALSNIVWMVDGSRRFPMIDGDILWIPEGNVWVELEGKTVAEHKLYLSETKPVGAPNPDRTLLPLPTFKHKVKVGSFDCIEITLHKESLRPVFKAAGYVDIEVTYLKGEDSSDCSN